MLWLVYINLVCVAQADGSVIFGLLKDQTNLVEGLYLQNLRANGDNAPNLTLTNRDAELELAISLVNGYTNQMILRREDDVTCCITNITCRNADGQIVAMFTNQPAMIAFPYHLAYENLRQPHLLSPENRRIACGCGATRWTRTLRLRRLPVDRFNKPHQPVSLPANNEPLPLPQSCAWLDIRIRLVFDYVVSDRAGRHCAVRFVWIKVWLDK